MLNRVLRVVIWAVSALTAVAYFTLAIRHILGRDPAGPEERALLDLAGRMARGQAPYAESTVGGAMTALPGLPFLIAPFVDPVHPQAVLARIAALMFSTLAVGLVVIVARLESESWTMAGASGAFACAGLAMVGGTPGAASAMSLMLALALGGLLALRQWRGVWGALGAALCFTLALAVHPLALWFAVATAFYLAFDNRPRLITFTLATGALVSGGYVLLSQWLGPWFNFAAWDAPAQAVSWQPGPLLHYVGDVLLGRLSVLVLPAVLTFALPTAPWRGPGGMWVAAGMASLLAGAVATQSTWGSTDALGAMATVLALVGPISIQRVTRHLAAWPGSSRLGGQGVVLAALALQFVAFIAGARGFAGLS